MQLVSGQRLGDGIRTIEDPGPTQVVTGHKSKDY